MCIVANWGHLFGPHPQKSIIIRHYIHCRTLSKNIYLLLMYLAHSHSCEACLYTYYYICCFIYPVRLMCTLSRTYIHGDIEISILMDDVHTYVCIISKYVHVYVRGFTHLSASVMVCVFEVRLQKKMSSL